MVRVRGLEPPRLAALEPKSSASTNSATLALFPPQTLDSLHLKVNHEPCRMQRVGDYRRGAGKKTNPYSSFCFRRALGRSVRRTRLGGR